MPGPSLERLQPVLRGLAAGADPHRLLRDTLHGALAATRATDGLLVRSVGGQATVVVSSGNPGELLREAAEVAIASERLVRKRAPGSPQVVAAEPLRVGGKVVGALGVQGEERTLDPTGLPLYADTASVVLSRVAPSGVGAAVAAVDALSGLGATLDTATVLERIFDTLQLVVGSASGFCTLFRGGTMRVAYYRAVERERLVAAAKRPEFREMVSSRDIRVDPPNHPVVELVARLGEVAVGLPLVADGRPVGHVVVLLPAPPDSDRRALLAAFARHAANVLRAAEVFDQLGEHEEQLSATVHSMANPVVVVDSSGRAVEVNGAAAELFRLASTFEVGHPIAGKLGSELLESMLADGSDRTAEVVLGTEEPRVYRATVRRMRAAGGRAMGSILVLDDLTSERELDAKKADFVAVIGHELRTPLTVMKGYLQTLTKRWESLTDERRGKALDALEDNLSRLERLIDDLLFISAVEQRKCTVDLAMTDVGALLEARAGGRVVVRRPRRPVEIELDEAKVGQVVHHLLDNALKYSEGQVVLELVDRGESVEISVTDSGPGIYSGDIPLLFERFRQLDGSSTRAHGGVGIGLYISRRIVEALGGRLWCDSRLGVGSRFAFVLPKESPTGTAPAATTRAFG